jgi:hypothetical protein
MALQRLGSGSAFALVLCALRLCAAEPTPVALHGDTSRPDHSTFIVGEPVVLEFTVTGLPGGDTGLTLGLSVLDEHDRPVDRREVPVSPAAADGISRLSVPAPHERLGFYRVQAALSNGVTLPACGSRRAGFLTYAVVPDPHQRTLYPPEETFFGMQGGFGKPPVKPLLGIRWVLGGYSWRDAEPQRAGEFAAARREGTARPRPPLLGEETWVTYPLPCLYMAPAWAVEPSTASYCTGTLTPEGETAWREYCREVGRAFAADRPELLERLYQITWEPVYPWGYKGTDEQLIRIYEIAYPALHEADPSATVLGPTGAGISRNDVAWNARLLRKGLGRWLDGFSIHPYHTLPPEREGLIDRVRELRAVVEQFGGKPMALYGTEQGFPTKEDPANDLLQARGLLRANLIMLGEGYRANFAFYIVDYPTEPGYGYYYNLMPNTPWGPERISPKPAAAAYATQSFLLEGHRSAGAIEWLGPTAWGYAFERPGSIFLALWDFGDEPREVSLPVGSEVVQLWDWMGNRRDVPTPGGTLTLTLAQEPAYVTGVAPEVWSAKAVRPLRLEAARLTTFAGARATVNAVLTTAPGSALRGRLVVRLPPGFSGSVPSRTVRLGQGATRRVGIEIDIPVGTALGSYPATVVLGDETGKALAAAGMIMVVAEPVRVLSVAPAVTKVGGCALAVRLREEQQVPFRGTVEAVLEGVPRARAADAVRIKAGQTVEVVLAMPDAAVVTGRSGKALITVVGASGARCERVLPVGWLTAGQVTAAPSVDGRLADWPTGETIAVKGRSWLVRSPEFYSGTADSAAEVQCAWDHTAFYLACTARDDVFVQDQTGFMTWKGDCLQVAFDLDPDRGGEASGNLLADKARPRRVTEIDLALTAVGPEAYRTISFSPERLPVAVLGPEAVRLAALRDGADVTYEVAIAWAALGAEEPPAAGSTIGFALTVNDLDEPGQPDPSALGLFGGIAGKKEPDRFGRVLLVSAESAGRVAASASLRFDGVLGQSQPADSAALPFLACTGAATDTAGLLWTVAGERAYAFDTTALGIGMNGLRCMVPLPAGVVSTGVCWDRQRLFLASGDGTVHALDPVTKTVTSFCRWPEKARAFALAPVGVSAGFAAKAKAFVLEGNAVYAYDHAGKELGEVLALPPPGDPAWWYCAVGLEPASGDLLVGSYWPDSKVYRFAADGQQVTTDGWPRGGHAQALAELDGQAWILLAGGSAAPLPVVRRGPGDELPGLPAAWSWYHSGLTTSPAQDWWVASSQGLVQYSWNRQPARRRLGGLPGVSLLALAPDGTVVAAVEGGQRFVRLGLADAPETALRSDANEPWRTGNGWTAHACGLAWDGESFLVLDRSGRRLWRFDPWHTAWGETPWLGITQPDSLTAPRALAVGDGLAWVLDDQRLLEAARADSWSAREAILPASVPTAEIVALAAEDDVRLYAALAGRVVALDRAADGRYRIAWEKATGMEQDRGLAVSDRGVVVSGRGEVALLLLAATDGRVLSRIAPRDVPGGVSPGCVAACGRWAVLADEAHHRLLRFGIGQ